MEAFSRHWLWVKLESWRYEKILNIPITSNEIESVVKGLPMRKSSGSAGFMAASYHALSINADFSQTIPQDYKWGNPSKLIVWGNYSVTHTGEHKKRRL